MIKLCKYPYPYKSALAISNDSDGMRWSAFQDWHAFVNGTEETPYGDGLGLEVGDSFWYWSESRTFALYHNAPYAPAIKSPEHDFVVEMARAGWLDTLHGLGTWGPPTIAKRDELAKPSMKCPNWASFPVST